MIVPAAKLGDRLRDLRLVVADDGVDETDTQLAHQSAGVPLADHVELVRQEQGHPLSTDGARRGDDVGGDPVDAPVDVVRRPDQHVDQLLHPESLLPTPLVSRRVPA